ncbi:MAG: GIY-YIG nuclease family protein [Patescibacteria group bacterium]
MYHYTYVLKSRLDGKLYVGYTNDLFARLATHNAGMVPSTKSRRPFDLVYYEACLSATLARNREQQLKTGFGRAYLKRRLGSVA